MSKRVIYTSVFGGYDKVVKQNSVGWNWNCFSEKNSFKQKNYQNDLLQKVFHFESQNSPIVELNLERREETLLSYIYILEYIYEHKIS